MRVKLLYIELFLSLAIQQLAKGRARDLLLVTTFPNQYDIFVVVIKYPSIFFFFIKKLIFWQTPNIKRQQNQQYIIAGKVFSAVFESIILAFVFVKIQLTLLSAVPILSLFICKMCFTL